MAEPLTLLRQPETVTIEMTGADGQRALRRATIRALRRDDRGVVLEALCAETGQPQSFCASRIARIRHGTDCAETPDDFVARITAEVEGAPPPSDWVWIDRLVMLAIAAVVVLVTLRMQGPREIGPYAQFWSMALFLAGGLVGWAVLKSLLGLPRGVRVPRKRV